MLVFKYVYFAIVVLHIGEPELRKEPHMGELIFPDFQTKDRRYTKGGGIDDMKFPALEDTSPSEMPPVWPSFEAPEQDPA